MDNANYTDTEINKTFKIKLINNEKSGDIITRKLKYNKNVNNNFFKDPSFNDPMFYINANNSNIDDFIGEENEKIHYDKALIDKCDTESGRFHWLEYGDRPFLHLFSSETSMIKKALSENIIIKDILK